ncbi:unnamed protein product, partial [Rodentolepis nana]
MKCYHLCFSILLFCFLARARNVITDSYLDHSNFEKHDDVNEYKGNIDREEDYENQDEDDFGEDDNLEEDDDSEDDDDDEEDDDLEED